MAPATTCRIPAQTGFRYERHEPEDTALYQIIETAARLIDNVLRENVTDRGTIQKILDHVAQPPPTGHRINANLQPRASIDTHYRYGRLLHDIT